MGVEMLDLRSRESGNHVLIMQVLVHQMPCLFVEGDGIAYGCHLHRLIARCETPVEGRFHQPRSQGMLCQFRRWRFLCLQHMQRTAVKDGPPRLTSLSVDHGTDLRMHGHVMSVDQAPSYVPFAFRLTQPTAVQCLVQGRESITLFKAGHLTPAPKGDSLAEDGSCHQ